MTLKWVLAAVFLECLWLGDCRSSAATFGSIGSVGRIGVAAPSNSSWTGKFRSEISIPDIVDNMTVGELRDQLAKIGPEAVHDALATGTEVLQEMYEGKRFSRDLAGPTQQRYGTFAGNLGPLGTMQQQPSQWTLAKLVNQPGYGDSPEAFHNYSAPWRSGPHPMWPVPPVPAGLEAVYGFQPAFFNPNSAHPEASPSMTGTDIDLKGFPVTSTQYDDPTAQSPVQTMDFRPEPRPNPFQMQLLHSGFPLSRVHDSWLNTQGAKVFAGRPDQWSTSPYPYGHPGEQLGSFGYPEPRAPFPAFHANSIDVGPPAGVSSERGTTVLHGGAFNIHRPSSIGDVLSLYPATAGMAIHPRNVMQRLQAEQFFRGQLLRPAVTAEAVAANRANLASWDQLQLTKGKEVVSVVPPELKERNEDTWGSFVHPQ